MKKILFIFSLLIFGGLMAKASQDNDSMLGTWDVSVQGTPQGNINVYLTLERVEGKLSATIQQPGTSQEVYVSNIIEKEGGLTLYFYAEGMDLYLSLKPSGEDKVSGYLMDQFPLEGTRKK